MNTHNKHIAGLPPEQEAIRAKCFHPNGTFIEFKKEDIEQSIPDRFEEQVRKYPDRIAIKAGSEQLTYQELNEAANRVANALLTQCGAGQEPVALLMEPGIAVITAILGILKSGKFYVPLDVASPSIMLDRILEASQASVLLTNSKRLSLGMQLAQNKAQLINVDELEPAIPGENLGLSIAPRDLTCLLYTSGTTGEPKGVTKNHRSVLHRIWNYTNDAHICAEDRLILLVSCGSSAAEWNLFGSLLNGATLYPFDLKEVGLANLASYLIQEEVTICHFNPPAVFRHTVNCLAPGQELPKLRLIRLAGEPIYQMDLELYRAHFSRDCILNVGLSTTEAGSIRRYFIDRETRITENPIPIGYEVEGMKVRLLDEFGEEVGFNEVGEIVVTSSYLSPGYWRRPELNEAVFLQCPDGEEEQTYLTGDLGLMWPDGCLIHVGRKDFQVKINGNRIAVHEVEAALVDLDVIREAAVMARERSPGHQRLVAYVVSGDPKPTISELRCWLSSKLPEYMVPSDFVFLDVLPVTTTGKLDRLALPAPEYRRPELKNSYVMARTPAEENLVRIWSEVLGLDAVGIHDNFLDLGGDSLLASQVISRVIKTFHVEVPLRALFEAPTVADMAVVIIQNQAKKAEQEDINRMLTELESLPNEGSQRILNDENQSTMVSDI